MWQRRLHHPGRIERHIRRVKGVGDAVLSQEGLNPIADPRRNRLHGGQKAKEGRRTRVGASDGLQGKTS